MCRNKEVDIKRFAPCGDSYITNSKRQRFYAALAAFYGRFGGEAATQRVVEAGGRFPGPLEQYFV